jgi:hypothetical protein
MKASTEKAVSHAPREWKDLAGAAYEKFVERTGLMPAPWLDCLCQLDGKKKCRHKDCPRPPARDHVRGFVNRKTGERVLTIQPYFSVKRPDGHIWVFDNAANGEPVIFVDGLSSGKPYTIPEFTSLCEQFAAEHGWTAKVSRDSWYYPGRVILVEYRKTKEF